LRKNDLSVPCRIFLTPDLARPAWLRGAPVARALAEKTGNVVLEILRRVQADITEMKRHQEHQGRADRSPHAASFDEWKNLQAAPRFHRRLGSIPIGFHGAHLQAFPLLGDEHALAVSGAGVSVLGR
jgi:hypothetical protein